MFGTSMEGSDSDDRYEFLERLCKTGYGEIWTAQDRKLNQVVAIKKIERWFSDQPGALDLLRKEVVAGRKISSRNVLKIYDLISIERHDCLVMEFIEGCTLREFLRNEQPSAQAARDMVRQLCAGLSAIHATGFAHRDLRADNIIVDDEGRVIIIDLGIVHTVGADQSQRAAHHAPELNPSLILMDIYALGGLIAQIGGGTDNSALRTHRWLTPIVLKCRKTAPEERYSSPTEVLEELDRTEVDVLQPVPNAPRSRQRAVGFSGAVFLTGLSLLALRPQGAPATGSRNVRYLVMPSTDDSRSQMLADVISTYIESRNLQVTLLTRSIDAKAEPWASFKGPIITVGSAVHQSKLAFHLTVAKSASSFERGYWLEIGNHLPIDVLSRVVGALALRQPDSRFDLTPDGFTLERFASIWKASVGGPNGTESGLCQPSHSIPVALARAELVVRQFSTDKSAGTLECATIAVDRLQSLEARTGQAALIRTKLLRAEGSDEDAVRFLRSAVDALANPAPVYRALGEIALAQGFGPEASHFGHLAVQADPLQAQNYIYAGRAEIAERHDDEALRLLRVALSLDPRSAEAYRAIGGLDIRLGRFREAKVSLEKAVEIKPSPDSITTLGLANILCGDTQQGILLLSGAAAQNPTVQTLGTLGAAFRWVGNSIQSEKTLRSALKLGDEASRNGIELGKLAMINAQLHNFRKADLMIRKAGTYISALSTDLLYDSMVVDAFCERRRPCLQKFRLLRERRFLVALALRDPQVKRMVGDEPL